MGVKIEINIGEKEEDPIFTITDLLPHLAQDQMEKKVKKRYRWRRLKSTNW